MKYRDDYGKLTEKQAKALLKEAKKAVDHNTKKPVRGLAAWGLGTGIGY